MLNEVGTSEHCASTDAALCHSDRCLELLLGLERDVGRVSHDDLYAVLLTSLSDLLNIVEEGCLVLLKYGGRAVVHTADVVVLELCFGCRFDTLEFVLANTRKIV